MVWCVCSLEAGGEAVGHPSWEGARQLQPCEVRTFHSHKRDLPRPLATPAHCST